MGTTGWNYTANDNSEGQFGDRYVNDLTVTPGEVYMLYVSNWSQSGLAFDLTWDLQNGATLDCGVLPIELIALSAKPVGNFIDVD